MGTSVALASVGLSKTTCGSIGKNTSTVAMSPLLVFSLVKNSGCLLASAASPQAASALAVGQRADLRVFGAAHLVSVGHQFLVELRATLGQLADNRCGAFASMFGGCRAVAPPIGPQLLAEILDGVDLVVGHDHLPRHRRRRRRCRDRTRRPSPAGRHSRRAASACRPRPASAPLATKRVEQRLVGANGGLGLAARRGGVGIAPVDAMIVAATNPAPAVPPCRRAARSGCRPSAARPFDLFAGLIDDELGTGAVVKRDGVRLAIHRPNLPGDDNSAAAPAHPDRAAGPGVMKVSVT